MNNPSGLDYQTGANPYIEEESKLPFDPATVLIGLWRRRKIFAVIVAIFSFLGVVTAIMFGSKEYEAETVLIFRPVDVEEGDVATNTEDPKALYTQMNMVKILSNLEETKRRLNLDASPRSIGSEVRAEVQRNTKLLTIRVRWGTPQGAADIANTLRDVFLENQRRIRQREAKAQMVTLEALLDNINREVATAADELEEFTTKYNIIDVDAETQYYLQELASVELLYEQTKSDQKTVRSQLVSVEGVIEDLKRKEGAGQVIDKVQLDRMNARADQLRQKLEQDRSARADMAVLAAAEVEYERAKSLYEKELISKAEYDKAKIAYEHQKAISMDTEESAIWKQELSQLETEGMSAQLRGQSSGLMDEMTLRAIDLRLQQSSLAEKVVHLEEARDRVRQKLDRLPKLQRGFVELNSKVTAKEGERANLQSALSRAKRAYESTATDFGVIADAKPPTASRSSNRKLLAAGFGILGVVLGFGLILALELLDTTIKSEGELGVKLSIPVLGTLGSIPPTQPHFPGQEASAPFEPFNIISRRIRQAIPRKGARILLVSAKPGEGKTWIAINMALSMGRREERVLLADAQVRSSEEQQQVYEQIHKATASGKIKAGNLFARDEEYEQEAKEKRPAPIPVMPADRSFGRKAKADTSERIKLRLGESVLSIAARLAEWFDKRFDTLLGTENRAQTVTEDRHDIRDLILYDGKPLKGIGEYLSYEAQDLDEVVWPTLLRGVEILPRFGAAIVPDLLASDRMREFLQLVSNEFSIVIVDGPGVFPFVDADLLAQLSDAIVLVVRSRYSTITVIRRAVERLKEAGVPIIGIILNDVNDVYQDKD